MLEGAKPVYEWFDGWKKSTAGARKMADLPPAARKYLDRIRELAATPITYVSVGTQPRPDHRRRVMIDVAIVGAGPCGLAAAIAAERAGLHAVTFDASCIVSGIYGYPTDLIFFSTPEKLEIGGVPFVSAGERPTRHEGSAYYRSVAARFSLELRQYETVERVEQDGGAFTLRTRTLGGATHAERAAAVVIATGYFGRPVRLGVPGEDRAHVMHFYREGHAAFDQDVVVVGGANSAVEAALLLQRGGARVTIVHYHEALGTNVKPWVLPDITARIADGSIQTRFECARHEHRGGARRDRGAAGY